MIKVVLVDDEPFLLRILESTIQWQDYGMAVTGTFFNGRQALDHIGSNEVDVVISDIKMPVMDGKELLQELKKTKPEIEFIVLSAYSEFELVRDFFRIGIFDYLTKIDIDSEQTKDVLSRLQMAVGKKNLAGGKGEELSYFLNSAVGELDFGEPSRISVLSIHVMNRNYLSEFKRFINNLHKEWTEAQCFITNAGEAVIVLKYTADLFKMVEAIRVKLQQIPYRILGGFSTSDYPDRVNVLLEEARKGANYSFYRNQKIVNYLDIPVREGGIQVTESVVLDMCKVYINSNHKNLNLMKVKEKIAEFFEAHKLWNLSYTDLISGTREIFLSLNYLLRERGSIDSVLEQKLDLVLSVLDNIYTFEKLKALLMEYLETVSAGVFQEGTSGLIERICFYINSNYEKDLNLRAIAKQFGISENYLSRLFVKENNITFKRYVNTLKIEKAKEYLGNTSLRIGEICDRLGYHNVEHFSRLFKEEIGMSPSEYRKLCK